MTSGRAQLQAAPTAGLGSRWCGKADRADDAPVRASFGAVLDDKASAEALNEMTFGLPLAIGGQRADRRQRHQRQAYSTSVIWPGGGDQFSIPSMVRSDCSKHSDRTMQSEFAELLAMVCSGLLRC